MRLRISSIVVVGASPTLLQVLTDPTLTNGVLTSKLTPKTFYELAGGHVEAKSPGMPAREIREMFGITQKNLEYLTINRFVNADAAAPAGSGTERLYSAENAVEIGVVLELRGLGCSYPNCSRMLGHFRTYLSGFYPEGGPKDPALRNYLPFHFNPLKSHTVLEQDVWFFLSVLRLGARRYYTYHVAYGEHEFGPGRPYGLDDPIPPAESSEGASTELQLVEDDGIGRVWRECDSRLSINLARLSRKVDNHLRTRIT